IGRPVANTQLYILDTHGQPVPVGVAGELYIGGDGLADGYLKRPSLTAERFSPDPFSAEPGSRLYWTGDLARYLPSGEVEFIGRTDYQVKLRGYRIELGEVESVLKSHPRVRDAVVTLRELHDEPQLLAYVIPRHDDPEMEQARASYLSEWLHVYDDAYKRNTAPPTDFDIAGWNSSYTGEPIPAEEMRPWVEQTVSTLRALNPSDVLEVGCGTGLLLTRLAPSCRSYLGLDFSPTVVARLGSYVSGREDLAHVSLRQAAAHELSFLEDDSVDLVVLNSVVQYFPDVDYLLEVLSQALRVTRPGGHVFVGDVRSLPLLGAFHTSVQLHKAAAETPLSELRQRVTLAQRHEKELLLDSALFEELGRSWEKAGRVTCRLKEAGYDNEVSRFRYDVTLTVGPKEEAAEPERWVEWDEGGSWKAALEEALGEQVGAPVGVKGIRDGRVAAAVEAARLLQAEEVQTAGELAALSAAATGENTDEVAAIARRHGAELVWKGFGAEGVYDAIFNPRWAVAHAEAELPRDSFRKFANAPAPSAVDAEFGRELRQHVRERL
ncbi:MAG TPA: methyltransferase domain-containing protein, partial [Pyrinomonadaceae bacterium]